MDNIIKKNLTSDHVVEKAEITEVLQQYRHAKLKECTVYGTANVRYGTGTANFQKYGTVRQKPRTVVH